NDAPLPQVFQRLATPVNGAYAEWQVAGLAGLVVALDRQNLAFPAYESKAGPILRPVLSKFGPLFDQARTEAQDPGLAEAQKLVAIQLLARRAGDQSGDIGVLSALLGPQNSPGIQNAALTRLRRLNAPQVAQVLLQSWRTCGLNQRQDVLNALFSRPEWLDQVLTALEQGKLLPGELGTLQQQKLLNHSQSSVRERAARLFARTTSDRKAIVSTYQGVLQLPGDRAKGRELFTKNCSICHRLRGEGQAVGPDLGTMTDKPADELLVAVLDPNRAVDPAYLAYTAVTKDDRELTGVLASESPNSISLRLAGGSEETVLRSNLIRLSTSGHSLMPEGFETGLKQQDLADLIAFILKP
ncbi:MAG TPA: c-type cytochrome, partial [Patescibacteria group bacterium]|nr:c-type cytochrome [Patescibacteria group bacterium]